MQIISINRKLGFGMHIDFEVLKNCADNDDRKAQKELHEYCYKFFMPLCYRYNANEEDARSAFNHAFVKIIYGLKSISLEEINFYSWAKRIVTNVLIDEYRKTKNHQKHYFAKETERELEICSDNSVNEAESSFGYDLILKMIDELPEVHALVFKLYVIEGYGHKEIAASLKISEGTSKWHLSMARKLLREKLEKMETYSEKRMVI